MQTTSAALIGRDADLQALREAFDASAAGSTRTIIVGGEAGIGKTRLVAEFAGALPANVVVVRGQSVDFGRDAPPYAPIVSMLRALGQKVGTQALTDAAGSAADSLGLLLPELDAAPELSRAAGGSDAGAGTDAGAVGAAVGAAVGGGASGTGRRQNGPDRLYDAVAAVLENVAARHQLVVVIEDLHWADQASLALLRFLIRVIENSPILFALTFRSDELRRGSTLRAWLPELDRIRRVERRELSRLNRRQSRQMATAILGSPLTNVQINQLFARADGVPFFIEELIGCRSFQPEEYFPDNLKDIVLARYELLADETRSILRLIAAGGDRVEHELLVQVCSTSVESIDDAAREAIEANVLTVDGTAYGFRHALVREAIHEQLLPGERVRFHTRYAQALEEGHGESNPDATAISYHWMAAHNVRKAFSSSVAAMQQARASYAFATSARMGERALELWGEVEDAAELAGMSRVDLLAETSYILRNAGESVRAIALIDEAIDEAGAADPLRLAGMLRNKASYLANVGRVGSITLLREALTVLADEPRSVMRAYVLGELAARLMLEAHFDAAVQTADEAFEEAVSVNSRQRMSVAANIRGMSRVCAGDIDQGLADLELAGQLAVDNDTSRLRYLVNQSDALHLIGRFDAAVRLAEAGAEEARQRGVERTSGVIFMTNAVGPLFALGQTERADELLDRALELDPPISFVSHLQRLKLQSVLWSGDANSAERMLFGWRAGLDHMVRIDMPLRLGLAATAAEIALARGDLAGAWAQAGLVLDPDRAVFPAYDLPLLMIAARIVAAARAVGVTLAHPAAPNAGSADTDDIENRLRAALLTVQDWPTAPAYLAVIDAELGGPDRLGTDTELWSRAAAAIDVDTAPAQLAPYALLRLAEASARDGDRAAARQAADAASALATRIGLGHVVARVADLLRRLGASGPQQAEADDIGSLLTDRERQVLGLLAQGLSNRQIADRLFISVKTASVHVSNILRKTGTATRTEAAWFARTKVG